MRNSWVFGEVLFNNAGRFAAAIVAFASIYVTQQWYQGVLSSDAGVLFTIIILLAFVVWIVVELQKRVDSLSDRLLEGVATLDARIDRKVDFFPVEQGEEEIVFAKTLEIVRSAKKSLRVLNSFAEERPSEAYPEGNRKLRREEYFSELESIMEGLHNYERVVQLEPGERVTDRYHQRYIDHFKKMIELRDSRPGRIQPRLDVKAAKRLYPSTFIIVDDRLVVWQLNRIQQPTRDKPTKERIRMRGLVVIEGKDEEDATVSVFKRWFDDAYRSGERLEAGQLEPPPGGSREYAVSPLTLSKEEYEVLRMLMGKLKERVERSDFMGGP